MFYVLASTSFIALPHEPILLHYGREFGILLPLLFSIVPTILGCYIDYLLLGPLFRHRIFSRVRTNHVSLKFITFFRLNPFVTIFLAALSPVPFYPIRILSIVSAYSTNKYTLAVLLGRLPRFALLAAGGQILGLSNTVLIVIFTLLSVWYVLTLFYKIHADRAKYSASSLNQRS